MLTEPERKPEPAETESQPGDRLRKIVRYLPIAILVAAIYVITVLWSRWGNNRDLEERARTEAAAQRRAEDEKSLETLGGTKFDILGFYATPGLIHRGDAVQLCYGVANAQSVKIEPDIHRETWPSVNRCIDITPKKTTTYTLTADDGHGKTKTATLTIEVH